MIKTLLRRRKPRYSLDRLAMGDAIAGIMDSKGLALSQVAREVGISTGHLEKLVLGKKGMTLEVAVSLSKALEQELEAFLILKGEW